MLICVAGLGLLFTVLDGAPANLPLVMLALAVFGLGQGLFISPNNSALMAAAPARLTGEAGGLLNVMRSLGISMGIAAAASLLAWRLAALTGAVPSTLPRKRSTCCRQVATWCCCSAASPRSRRQSRWCKARRDRSARQQLVG